MWKLHEEDTNSRILCMLICVLETLDSIYGFSEVFMWVFLNSYEMNMEEKRGRGRHDWSNMRAAGVHVGDVEDRENWSFKIRVVNSVNLGRRRRRRRFIGTPEGPHEEKAFMWWMILISYVHDFFFFLFL